MALEYLKLANVTASIAVGEITRAALLADVTDGEVIVVNLKGRILTVTNIENHLDDVTDGETVVRA